MPNRPVCACAREVMHVSGKPNVVDLLIVRNELGLDTSMLDVPDRASGINA